MAGVDGQIANTRVIFGGHVSRQTVDDMEADLSELEIPASVSVDAGEGGPGEYFILVLAGLMPVLNAFLSKAGEDAWSTFRRIFHLNARDEAGAPIGDEVCIRDDARRLSLVINGNVRDQTFRNLLDLNARGMLESGPHSHRRLHWNERMQCWLMDFKQGVSRRLPPRPARVPIATAMPAPHIAGDAERKQLDKASRSWGVITAERKDIAEHWLRGTPPERIERVMLMSGDLVRAIILDYHQFGVAALEPEFEDGVAARVDDDVAAEIIHVAQTLPRYYREQYKYSHWSGPILRPSKWTIRRLSNFLIRTGVIEDIDYGTLNRLAVAEGLDIPMR
jgi:hypothetical protein